MSIMSGHPNTSQCRNLTYAGYCSIAKKFEVADDYKLPENYLELMVTVNQMVKDPSCPNNYKNRFYDYKSRVIKQAIKEGRVTDVYDEGTCVSLVIDGTYKFHQLKRSYAGVHLTPIGKREYFHEATAIPFDKNVFTQFQLAAIFYLGKARYERYGKEDPKCNHQGSKVENVSEPIEREVYDENTYSLGGFLNYLHVPFSSKVAIASIMLTGDVQNLNREQYYELISRKRVPKEYRLPTNLLELMVEVNKMVKDENCPKNFRNRFYRHKKQIIHAYADDQKISDVWEERDTWSILIDGKYRFHQLKRDHKYGYPKHFMGTREYVPEDTIPFDKEKYDQFQLAAQYFLGRRAARLEEALMY